VSQANVEVDGTELGSIGKGLLVLLAVKTDDGLSDVAYMRKKLLNLRIFPDGEGRMNRSVVDVGGEILVISQFTLYGDCRKGNRPSYTRAANPKAAETLYLLLIEQLGSEGLRVECGEFGAMMEVSLVNAGPVTLIIDSDRAVY
jgi:D-tyrosyl-tRNA(Tyr) deacylase